MYVRNTNLVYVCCVVLFLSVSGNIAHHEYSSCNLYDKLYETHKTCVFRTPRSHFNRINYTIFSVRSNVYFDTILNDFFTASAQGRIRQPPQAAPSLFKEPPGNLFDLLGFLD